MESYYSNVFKYQNYYFNVHIELLIRTSWALYNWFGISVNYIRTTYKICIICLINTITLTISHYSLVVKINLQQSIIIYDI